MPSRVFVFVPFFRGKRHQQEADVWHTRTDGRGTQLGLWHTHPEPRPTPSVTDYEDFRSVITTASYHSVGIVYIIVGTEFFSNRLPLQLSSFLEQLSVSNHFDSMARGVIDARDLWYFLSLTAVFLGFAWLNLIKNKFGNRKKVYRNYQVAVMLLTGIAVLSPTEKEFPLTTSIVLTDGAPGYRFSVSKI